MAESEQEVSWHVELAIEPGRFDAFAELTDAMVESARREQDVLNFERYINTDRTIVHIYERYASSTAASNHLRLFRSTFSEQFSQLVQRRSFVVCGDPSRELAELLDSFGASLYVKPLARL